jgi:hypothetical protein
MLADYRLFIPSGNVPNRYEVKETHIVRDESHFLSPIVRLLESKIVDFSVRRTL